MLDAPKHLPGPADRIPLEYPNKSTGLVELGTDPLVAETPASLLDDDTTPTDRFFIRNNGRIPKATKDPDRWTVTIDGEVERPLHLTFRELRSRFEVVTQRMLMECGGNGRSFFDPPAKGNRWTHGGVGCAEWTGVRVADVVREAGLKRSAVFSAHFGDDAVVTPAGRVDAMSRGVPIRKLMDENNLIAWAINGEPLPLVHGFPLRLVIPGWPGSVSAKWLTRIWIRDREHDGAGMQSYRVPIRPVAPGTMPDDGNLRILESMPVRSIITSPAAGAVLSARACMLRGAAWAGDDLVRSVAISIDRGASWREVSLAPPKNRYDWQRWTHAVELAGPGNRFEIWVRATDERGETQPLEPDNWNPHGYGGNPIHRIAVSVAAP
jgi:DMSO/TMAO reductase YedYZ molybdopterin-dependent catalytic subunit